MFLRYLMGAVLVIAGLYIAFTGFYHPIGILLVCIGLIGIQIQQGERSVLVSLFSLVVITIGTLLFLICSFEEALVLPGAESFLSLSKIGESLSGFILIGGYALFGIGIFTAGVNPRSSGLSMMIAALLLPVLPPWGGLLFGVVLAWLGLLLMADREAHTASVGQLERRYYRRSW